MDTPDSLYTFLMKRALVLLGFILAAGCVDDPDPAAVPTKAPRLKECGEASYYHRSLAGEKTASGETYRPDRMTAAHRSLPFDRRVTVTRMDSQKSIIVRINDRGPFVDGRIIDLSWAAAKKLDLYGGDGIANVCLLVSR